MDLCISLIRSFIKHNILALLFIMMHDQTFGCRLWSICTKNNKSISQLPYEEKDLVYNQLNSFFLQSSMMNNGWSLLDYPDTTSNFITPIIRSETKAYIDSVRYWAVVDSLLLNGSGKIGMGHLRLASSGINSIPNPHPWMFYRSQKSYAMMHNGTIDKNILYNLITNNGSDITWLQNHEPETFDGSDWQSDGWVQVVDSELLMLFIMQQVENENDIYLGLQLALSNLMSQGVVAHQLNLILSDGSFLYCFGGSNGLSYAESSDHYAVMTQPENSGLLTWTGLNNGELIVISDNGLEKYPDFIQLANQDGVLIPRNPIIMTPAFPNPFNSSLQFSFENIQDTPIINISIYNIVGNLIDTISKENIRENDFIRWSPPLGTSSGTYYIHAKIKNSKLNQKILFIK